MSESRNVLELIRECEREVQSSGQLGEELLYADSARGNVEAEPFGSVKEALQYRFQKAVRQLAESWAPLAARPDVIFSPVDLPEGQNAQTTSLALFPKDPLLGYLVMRATDRGRVLIHVGVLRASDDDSSPGGNPGGDDAHVALPASRWVM